MDGTRRDHRHAGTLAELATAGGRTMKLPRTLAAINVALAARHAQGLSVEIVDMTGEPLRDEHGELFMRMILTLDDGAHFKVDSDEAGEFLRTCMAHQVPAGAAH